MLPSHPISPKTFCSLSPYLMMLYIKFERNWPTNFRDYFETVDIQLTPNQCHTNTLSELITRQQSETLLTINEPA